MIVLISVGIRSIWGMTFLVTVTRDAERTLRTTKRMQGKDKSERRGKHKT